MHNHWHHALLPLLQHCCWSSSPSSGRGGVIRIQTGCHQLPTTVKQPFAQQQPEPRLNETPNNRCRCKPDPVSEAVLTADYTRMNRLNGCQNQSTQCNWSQCTNTGN